MRFLGAMKVEAVGGQRGVRTAFALPQPL
jgi:hypothetical protein